MSRLSLKPGGEPGMWEVVLQAGENGIPFTYVCPDVPDSDLRDIRHTINEYLDTKDFLFSDVRVAKPLPKPLWARPWVILSGGFAFVLFAVASLFGTFWFLANPPKGTIAPSTGGVIDQLCMRPDIECSTSIRYVHPQAGVPHQERETYSADSLSEAHLEEQ